MAENGLYKFYGSAAQFNLNVWLDRSFSHVNDDEIQPLTMQQFKRVMILVFCFNALAIIAFLVETFIFKWMMWRNRKYIYLLFRYLVRNIHLSVLLCVCLLISKEYRFYQSGQKGRCATKITPKNCQSLIEMQSCSTIKQRKPEKNKETRLRCRNCTHF